MKKTLTTLVAIFLITNASLMAQTGNIITMTTTATGNISIRVDYTGTGTIKANGKDMNGNGSYTTNIVPSAGNITIAVTGSIQVTRLYVNNCSLTHLDASQAIYLTWLWCYSNQLTELDLPNSTALTELNCRDNQLTELDVSNYTGLKELWCYNNQLTELNVSNNTALTKLWCYNNQLTELDVTNNTELTELNCHSNQLSSLDLSQNQLLVVFQAQSQTVETVVLDDADTYANPIYYHNQTAVEYVRITGTAYPYGANVPKPTSNYNINFTANIPPNTSGFAFSGQITLIGGGVEVTFNSNGGTAIEPKVVLPGTIIGQVFCEFPGYLFEGWYTEPTFVNKWNLDTNPVMASMSLYAKWTGGSSIEDTQTNAVTLYPNPAQHTLYIQSEEAVEQVIIHDISGRMMQQIISPSTSIDVSALANGIYLFKVKTTQGETVKRIGIRK